MTQSEEKAARLAAALRANLRKRKVQARAEEAAPGDQRQWMNVPSVAAADPAE